MEETKTNAKENVVTLAMGTPRYGEESAGYAHHVTIVSNLTRDGILEAFQMGVKKSGLLLTSYAAPLRMSPYQDWSYSSRFITFQQIEKLVQNGFNPLFKGQVTTILSWRKSYVWSNIRLDAIIQSCMDQQVQKEQGCLTCLSKPITLEEMMHSGLLEIKHKQDFADFFLQLVQFGNRLFNFRKIECQHVEI